MAFNGSGVFNRIHNWVQDKANSIYITASRMDAEMDGMATALSQCIVKDGQTPTPTIADVSLTGTPVAPTQSDGNASTRIATTAFVASGFPTKTALQTALETQQYTAITTSGTAGTYTATPNPALSAYAAGQRFRVKINAGVAGAATLNLNSLGAKDIKVNYFTDGLTDPLMLQTGGLYDMEYDGTRFVVLNPCVEKLQQSDLQTQAYTAVTTAGTAPTYTATPSPALSAYAAGQRFRVKFHSASTGAATLNLNGLGAKSLKIYNGAGAKATPVSIAANFLTDVEYDGTDMVIFNPAIGLATLASPTFTGTPAAPTATAGTDTTQLATTAFVTTADNLKANLASPTFTGTPAAPTATAGTNTTQLATTAFATTADNLKANINSPTFTGTPLAPTPATGNRSTQIATTQKFTDEFASYLSRPGYQKLPSGYTHQWGQVDTDVNGAAQFNYPVAFANGPLSWSVIGCLNGAAVYCLTCWPLTGEASKNAMQAFVCNGSGTPIPGVTVYFNAWGY